MKVPSPGESISEVDHELFKSITKMINFSKSMYEHGSLDDYSDDESNDSDSDSDSDSEDPTYDFFQFEQKDELYKFVESNIDFMKWDCSKVVLQFLGSDEFLKLHTGLDDDEFKFVTQERLEAAKAKR